MSGTQSADPGENDPNRRMYADSQTASSADFGRLEWRLSMMRDRIDVLQMQTVEVKHPLKQASNWIAILALLVSLGAASASYWQTREKNIQEARSELKDFSHRSLEISRELRELETKYRDDPSTLNNNRSPLRRELRVLTLQAADIIERYPSKISAAECLPVAQFLSDFGNYDRSFKIRDIAIDRAGEAESLVTLYREYARDLFTVGEPEAAREKYEQALNVFQNVSVRNRNWVNYANGYTEYLWGSSESRNGECQKAEDHLNKLSNYIRSLGEGSFRTELLYFQRDLRERIENCRNAA